LSRLWFLLKEAFSGLGRAKLSAFFSIVMVALAFTLLGSFYLSSKQAEKFLDYVRGKVEIEAFLSDSLSASDLQGLRNQLLATRGIKKVQFVSKDEAAEIFKKDFGEDINSVLEFNPLPASFKVFIKNENKNSHDVGVIAGKIEKIPGVESVTYRKILLTLIDRRVKLFYEVMSGFGGALVLLSVFLVYNSMRLAISHKKRIIDAMKLVGASRGFVRLPFLLAGVIQGFTGGMLAAGVIFGLVKALMFLIQENVLFDVLPPLGFFGSIVGIASLLGLFSTMIATGRYIKEGMV
jgi:cell division transport system permease protein